MLDALNWIPQHHINLLQWNIPVMPELRSQEEQKFKVFFSYRNTLRVILSYLRSYFKNMRKPATNKTWDWLKGLKCLFCMCATLVRILSTHVNVWMLGEHAGLPVSPFLKRWRWKIHRAGWPAALVLSVSSGFSWVSFVNEQGGSWFRRPQVSAPDPPPPPWVCTHAKQ